MKQILGMALLGSALLLPSAAFSQDRDHHDNRYEDRARHDTHEWNERENEAYRRYIQERHMHYREFQRLNRKQQEAYWEWRHRHMDNDRHM
jgi:hypothetical protein